MSHLVGLKITKINLKLNFIKTYSRICQKMVFSFRSEHQKAERDVQGAGGGGFNTKLLSYENPALNISSDSFNSRQRNDSSFMGSNDFIGKLILINTSRVSKLLSSTVSFRVI